MFRGKLELVAFNLSSSISNRQLDTISSPVLPFPLGVWAPNYLQSSLVILHQISPLKLSFAAMPTSK